MMGRVGYVLQVVSNDYSFVYEMRVRGEQQDLAFTFQGQKKTFRQCRHSVVACFRSKPRRFIVVSHNSSIGNDFRQHCAVHQPVDRVLVARRGRGRPGLVGLHADSMNGNDAGPTVSSLQGHLSF